MTIFFYSKQREILNRLKSSSFELFSNHKELIKQLEVSEKFVLIFDYDSSSKIYLQILQKFNSDPKSLIILYTEKLSLSALKQLENQQVAAAGHLKGPLDAEFLEEIVQDFLDDMDGDDNIESSIEEQDCDVDEETGQRSGTLNLDELGTVIRQTVMLHRATEEAPFECSLNDQIQSVFDYVFNQENPVGNSEEINDELPNDMDDGGGITLDTEDGGFDLEDDEISAEEENDDESLDFSMEEEGFDLGGSDSEEEDESGGGLEFGNDNDDSDGLDFGSDNDDSDGLDFSNDNDDGEDLDFGSDDDGNNGEELEFGDEISDDGSDDALNFSLSDEDSAEEGLEFGDATSSEDDGGDSEKDGDEVDLSLDSDGDEVELSLDSDGDEVDLSLDSDGDEVDLSLDSDSDDIDLSLDGDGDGDGDVSGELNLDIAGSEDEDSVTASQTLRTEIASLEGDTGSDLSLAEERDGGDSSLTASKTLKTEVADVLARDNSDDLALDLGEGLSLDADKSCNLETIDPDGTATQKTVKVENANSNSDNTGGLELGSLEETAATDDALNNLDEESTDEFVLDGEENTPEQPAAFDYSTDTKSVITPADVTGDIPVPEGDLHFSTENGVDNGEQQTSAALAAEVEHEKVDLGIIKNSEEELLRLQGTIANLRSDVEHYMEEIATLQKELDGVNRQNHTLKAENDELKIELSVTNRRHFDEIEDYKNQIRLFDKKKVILEEKIKELEAKNYELGNQARVDVNKVRQREKELENQLDLIKHDADAQIQNRDSKILQLKRKIDTLEFNMENLLISEKKAKEDLVHSEEKLKKLMMILRNSLSVIEDEVITDDEISKKIDQLKI